MATTNGSSIRKCLTGLFFSFCVFFPLTASGIHTAIPMPLLQSNAADLPAANWAHTLNKTMSVGLCQEGTHWRSCYTINANECAQLINTLTQSCTSKVLNTLPLTITPTVASLAGQQVGFCVGELFYKLAQPQLKATPECQQKPVL